MAQKDKMVDAWLDCAGDGGICGMAPASGGKEGVARCEKGIGSTDTEV